MVHHFNRSSGKRWIVISIAALALVAGGVTYAHADTMTSQNNVRIESTDLNRKQIKSANQIKESATNQTVNEKLRFELDSAVKYYRFNENTENLNIISYYTPTSNNGNLTQGPKGQSIPLEQLYSALDQSQRNKQNQSNHQLINRQNFVIINPTNVQLGKNLAYENNGQPYQSIYVEPIGKDIVHYCYHGKDVSTPLQFNGGEAQINTRLKEFDRDVNNNIYDQLPSGYTPDQQAKANWEKQIDQLDNIFGSIWCYGAGIHDFYVNVVPTKPQSFNGSIQFYDKEAPATQLKAINFRGKKEDVIQQIRQSLLRLQQNGQGIPNGYQLNDQQGVISRALDNDFNRIDLDHYDLRIPVKQIKINPQVQSDFISYVDYKTGKTIANQKINSDNNDSKDHYLYETVADALKNRRPLSNQPEGYHLDQSAYKTFLQQISGKDEHFSGATIKILLDHNNDSPAQDTVQFKYNDKVIKVVQCVGRFGTVFDVRNDVPNDWDAQQTSLAHNNGEHVIQLISKANHQPNVHNNNGEHANDNHQTDVPVPNNRNFSGNHNSNDYQDPIPEHLQPQRDPQSKFQSDLRDQSDDDKKNYNDLIPFSNEISYNSYNSKSGNSVKRLHKSTPKVVKYLRQIKAGVTALLHGQTIKNIKLAHHFTYFYIAHPVLAHRSVFTVGSQREYDYILHPGHHLTIPIKAIWQIKRGKKSCLRYQISLHNRTYFVTGKSYYTPNAYYQRGNFGHKKIRIRQKCTESRLNAHRKLIPFRHLIPNCKLKVKKLVKVGKRSFFVTIHNHYVTANKNWVKVIHK